MRPRPALAVVLALLASAAWAVIRPAHDLAAAAADATFQGLDTGDRVGAVAFGDFDGDGVADLSIAFPLGAGPGNGRPGAGDVVILYGGGTLAGEIDLRTYTGDSTVIFGRDAGDGDAGNDGLRLAFGDIDGDGRGDLAIAYLDGAGPANGRADAGDVIVVYGRADRPRVIDLLAYAGDSTVLYGRDGLDAVFNQMDVAIGDIDGDGRGDLAIGYPGGDGPGNGRTLSGDVVVVYGTPALRNLEIDLRSYAGDSTIFYGLETFDFCGGTLATGDVQGDGRADLAIGCGGGDGPANDRTEAGEAIVVYGTTALRRQEIDLRTYTGDSTVIFGRETLDAAFGADAAQRMLVGLAAGDVDGDGRADVAITFGGGDGPSNGRADAGEAIVVYGAANLPRAIDLLAYTGDSTVLYAPDAGDANDRVIPVAVGDLGGARARAVTLGLGGGDGPSNGRADAGEAIVVYGGAQLRNLEIDLRSTSVETAVVHGRDAGDGGGAPLAVAIGDLDGDRVGDLAIGFRTADGPANGRADAGEAAVVRGTFFPTPALAPAQALIDPAGTTADVTVRAAAGESWVQVNLGPSATVASPPAAANVTGAGAAHAISTGLLEAGDTLTIFVWTSIETGGIVLGVRSDTGTLDTPALPGGIAGHGETALRAFAATAVHLEFLSETGALLGETATTVSVADRYAATLCWDLSETTTRRFRAAGFDTSAGSAAFGLWIADTWGGAWRHHANATAVSGGATMRVCATGVAVDLPGGLGGAIPPPLVTPRGGGGACLAERAAPPALLSALRAARDRLLAAPAGRLLVLLYYLVAA